MRLAGRGSVQDIQLGDEEQIDQADPKCWANKCDCPLGNRVCDFEQQIVGKLEIPFRPTKSVIRIATGLTSKWRHSSMVRHLRPE